MAAVTYAEHGHSGLSRETAAIWRDGPEPEPEAPQPSAPRCARCGYRRDALGHLKSEKCQ